MTLSSRCDKFIDRFRRLHRHTRWNLYLPGAVARVLVLGARRVAVRALVVRGAGCACRVFVSSRRRCGWSRPPRPLVARRRVPRTFPRRVVPRTAPPAMPCRRTSRAGDALRATATLVEEQLRELRAALARTSSTPPPSPHRPRAPTVASAPRTSSGGTPPRPPRRLADVQELPERRRLRQKRLPGASPRSANGTPQTLHRRRRRERRVRARWTTYDSPPSSSRRGTRRTPSESGARAGEPTSRAGADDAEHVELDAELDAEFDADARHDAAARLRAQIEPLIDAVDASARRLRRDAKAAAAEARRATRGGRRRSSVVADAPLSPLFSRASFSPTRRATRGGTSSRVVRERKTARRTWSRARGRGGDAIVGDSRRDARGGGVGRRRRRRLRRGGCRDGRARKRICARWRAMYDALREEAGRGVSASEADALRLA